MAQQIANHESPKTTKLYDRTSDHIDLDEVEKIRIGLIGCRHPNLNPYMLLYHRQVISRRGNVMAEPIISKKTLYEFREHLVAYSTVRAIEILFDSADIFYDDAYEPNVSGVRRTIIDKYYHMIYTTKWEDARKLLRLFEEVLSQLELRIKDASQYTQTGTVRNSIDRLNLRLRHDGFVYQEGRIVSLGQVPSLTHLESIAVTADFPYLLRQLERIESSIDSDPWLAIGTAKELVETICKSVLTDLNKPLNPGWDLMDLCKETRKELKLTPDDIPNTNKAADTIKRLLNNLATIVQGLAELRNPYGTGHGHEGRARGLKPRHARLAAGAASTLALFLLESHRDAKTKGEPQAGCVGP